MNVAVEELGSCQKKLTISISAEEVNKEFQTVVKDLRKKIAIPGFRKGKASISTIKRQFRREISAEVKEKLLESSLKDALVEHKLSPVGSPSLDVKSIDVAEGQPVEYTVEVEFLPAVEIADYKGVEITKKPVDEASEEDINQHLEILRRQNAVNEPVEDDHVIAENDSVTVSYQRTLDGQPLGDPIKNYSFWLGVDNVLPEFTENLVGKKKGDHVEFSLEYQEDFHDKTVAGKTVAFGIDVENVENVVLPELDDEFAKDLEEESLDAVKEKIAQGIKSRREHESISDTKNRLLMKLAEAHEFDVPPSIFNEQKKKNPDKEDAEILKMLRAGIILTRIQEQENITVSDEEIDVAVERMAMQHQVPVAAMKSFMVEKGGLEQLRSDIGESKTLDFLYENAQIVEEE
jgi:trigger factor